jgi:hypothetical protein
MNKLESFALSIFACVYSFFANNNICVFLYHVGFGAASASSCSFIHYSNKRSSYPLFSFFFKQAVFVLLLSSFVQMSDVHIY